MLLKKIGQWCMAQANNALVGYHYKADTPLLQLSKLDPFRVQDAYEGVQIFGATGSGKSSGSGQALALAYLKAGFGGLVLCAKPDEAARWLSYAKQAGRSGHVVHMNESSQWYYNFLDHAIRSLPETLVIVNLLMVVLDAFDVAEGPSGGNENPFWKKSMRELLSNAIEPLYAANGTLRIDDLLHFISSAPTSRQEAYTEEWKQKSYFYDVLKRAMQMPQGRGLQRHEWQAIANYWYFTYANLDPKTRSNIIATLTGSLSPFFRGMLRERFCAHTTMIPELSHEGAIIIVDFPVKVWRDAGVVAAHIMKYQWQQATERRNIYKNTRPVFLWADECQFFLSEYDAEFQSTARSARAATVYITQNLPTYYSRLKSRDSRATADSLLGNFQTKIFHANTDIATNQYAADMIGRAIKRRYSSNWSENIGTSSGESWSSNWGTQHGASTGRSWGQSSSYGSSSGPGGASSSSNSGSSNGGNSTRSYSRSAGGGYSVNSGMSHGHSSGGGWSEQMDYIVEPNAFAAELRKGGQPCRGFVDAVMVQGGRRFQRTAGHWMPCAFKQ